MHQIADGIIVERHRGAMAAGNLSSTVEGVLGGLALAVFGGVKPARGVMAIRFAHAERGNMLCKEAAGIIEIGIYSSPAVDGILNIPDRIIERSEDDIVAEPDADSIPAWIIKRGGSPSEGVYLRFDQPAFIIDGRRSGAA